MKPWIRTIDERPMSNSQVTNSYSYPLDMKPILYNLTDEDGAFILNSLCKNVWFVKEVDDIGTKADQGRKAQRLKAAMRVLPAKIRKAGAIFLATNHIIDKVGVTYGPTRTTPGGRAVPFQSSVRIELLSTKQIEIKDKARPIGVTQIPEEVSLNP